MSRSPQEKSIGQQRAEMLPRCTLEGVEIVQEFKDEAKSGGGMAGRDSFHAMLRFCQERHKAGEPVGAIVCYNPSRFSRADSNETSAYIWEFRKVGVNRLLTWERWFDFCKEEDRTIFNLQQDFTNNRFLQDLSAGVLRGKKEAAAAGYFTGGMVPYAFDRLLIDDQGRVADRIRRGDKITLRRKGWHLALAPIPDDDADPARQLERQTVLWLFDNFATRNVSCRSLAADLNARGVPGPGSHYHRQTLSTGQSQWTVAAVRGILSNPVYCGVYEVGTVGKGKYHRLTGLEISKVAPGTPLRYGGTETIRTRLEHGGVVTEPTWRLVQEKLRERAKLKTFARTGGYILPGGLLHCGHCGGRMHSCTTRPKRGAKMYEYRQYRCSANQVKPGTCRHYAVAEAVVVEALLDQLLNTYLSPKRIAGLRRQLVEGARAKHAKAPE
jgi:DNA invertase Pin-like site-specific DNA recombinase